MTGRGDRVASRAVTGESAGMTATLGPQSRSRNLERLDGETFDVVVIGGGITGLGCALDAATRGLSVALVEQRDIAAGTSSRSSKLIHGGLRYLEQLDFGLVREALGERSLMLRSLCPHLVRPVSFVYPLQHRVWERAYVGAGVALYDLLAATGDNPLPRHRHLTRRGASHLVPALRTDRFTGAIRYWDAQVDDARHSVAVARTAAAKGAVVLTSARVVGIHQVGPERRVHGVAVADLETGSTVDVAARAVINASGVWTDQIQDMVGRAEINVRASKGIHILVPRSRIPSDSGLILRTEKSVLFVIPWGEHWIIGTTDTDWDLDLAHPAASQRDIDYLLSHVNELLVDPLLPEDIVGVYAGLRPLLHGESEATSKLSREHAVSEPVPSFFTVAGGKYTTYRVMAAETVDAVCERAGLTTSSITSGVPLVGAAGWERVRAHRARLARTHEVSVPTIDHLIGRYGGEVDELLDLIAADPELGTPLPGAPRYLRAEVRRAVTHEGALHVSDVMTRRTRISIEARDRGLAAAEVVAHLMADGLGWDDAAVERELWHYHSRVDAERDAQRQPDDATADAARLGAPDVRTGGGRPLA